MCGLIVFTRPHPSLDKNRMSYLIEQMTHRGHLSTIGIESNEFYTLGHIRLPVQGLDKKYNQPYSNGTNIGVFVGEVFNLPGENDAYAALDLLTSQGPLSVHSFDGFFSTAYTMGEQKLIVQTDHLGIKPLYFDGYTGVIASELRIIRKLRDFDCDHLYESNVLKWGYDMTGRTPLEGVRRLSPNTVLCFNKGSLVQDYRYGNITPSKGNLRTAIEKAVRSRMKSDIPIATLCSGGLDSTIVTMLANQIKPDLKVFHVDNGEEEFFDRIPLDPRAEVVKLTLDDVLLGDAIEAADVPVDLGSVRPQYALAKAVKAHDINVVLTGDGADELFGGYRRSKNYDSQHSDIFQELPGYHLPRLDAIMMSQTIELRSPFLAREVISLALGLPYMDRTEKQALKIAFQDLVPEAILKRMKVPLKTEAVINGGVRYRQKIMNIWRQLQ